MLGLGIEQIMNDGNSDSDGAPSGKKLVSAAYESDFVLPGKPTEQGVFSTEMYNCNHLF